MIIIIIIIAVVAVGHVVGALRGRRGGRPPQLPGRFKASPQSTGQEE